MQCGILLKLQSTVAQLSWSTVSTEISQWNNRLVMLVHQSYLSLCQFFLLPVELDDISRTLQWNNKLVISFFIFYFLWILHGHQWFKMSPKGLSRITALLDRLVWVFCFGLVLICNSICTYFSYMELKHHHIPLMFRALLQKALSVILTVCRRVPRELRGESFFAVLCLSHYQVLILKLFYFTY